jgi:hypothetical protein
MPSLPLWARALRAVDRIAWYAYHAHEIARDELLFAWLRPELRATATVDAYSDMRTYLPGGATFLAGLFPWEEALLAQPCIPRTGRVLLAAAGGGRELKALVERGYSVTAFEPNPVLFGGAKQVAAGSDLVQLIRGAFVDLIAAADGHGKLASIRGQDFDWILFGWGSFTHVTDRREQVAILQAARRLAPRAPLALSFFLRKPEISVSRSHRLRLLIRGTLRRAGGAFPIEPGLGYDSSGGFVYSFTMDELSELARSAGYRVEMHDTQIFPHAILLPVEG